MITGRENDIQDLQEYFQHNPDFMKNLKKDETPDFSKLPKNLQMVIQCSAVLAGETPILLSNENTISNMKRIYTFQSGKNLPIFAVRDGKVVSDSEIIGVPAEVMVPELYEVIFSNGYHVKCAPSTGFLVEDGGFLKADRMNPGDKVVNFYFDSDNPDYGIRKNTIEVKSSIKIMNLGSPCYAFMAMDKNILLPHKSENNIDISFVCIEQ